MAKKSLGYVELEWTCPNCETRNPGPQKTCSSCGMPQPENVEFQQPAQEVLIEDEAEIEAAKAGPDVHCYFCGTRNPASAETCSQCGASLEQAAARATGRVLGAHRKEPAQQIACAACGTMNEPDAAKCVQCGASLVQPEKAPAPEAAAKPVQARRQMPAIWLRVVAIAVALLVCGVCITFVVLSRQTEDLNGSVERVTWTRHIAVEGLVPVEHEDWRDDIPVEGVVGSCSSRLNRTVDNPVENAREVCGTPYTVDTGSGRGEVVQDCRYEVYEDWCEYTLDEWREVDRLELSGNDYQPRWPNARLQAAQREGERDEEYTIVFDTEQGTYTYHTSNADLFSRAQVGTRWVLKVNAFNGVTAIEPLQ